MSDERRPQKQINLDLSLGFSSQEEDDVEDFVENLVEEPSFMQLLRSESDPPPNNQQSPLPPFGHHLTPPVYYTNVTTPWNVSTMPAPPLPPPHGVVSVATPSPYPPSGQVLQPPHPIQDGVGALENPRPGPRLGRPPAGHQARRNSSRSVAVEKTDNKPPYPWSTSKSAVVHSFNYLFSNKINVISGQVHCKPCDRIQTLEYNLKEKFEELNRYISRNNEELRERAPEIWMNPKYTLCDSCESPMKPVFGEKKEEINWLFLYLGQMLGSCTLEQLRYFCYKTGVHRTGSKDHVLYLTYLGLFKQLNGSFSQ